MSRTETQYLDLAKKILDEGEERTDKAGITTKALFGYQLRCDLRKEFPAITTKKLYFKGIKSELLWFIEGSNDERRLAEIHYGKPREELKDKTTIWTANAAADYWLESPARKFEGDVGRIYGVQWRHWRAGNPPAETDQLMQLLHNIKTKPEGRRHVMFAYNPGDFYEASLPPCHCLFQFFVGNDNSLSCKLTQRSADLLLGVPFDLSQGALFTHMMAQVLGMEAREFILSFGDVHIYEKHYEQMKEQLSREMKPSCSLWLNPEINDIEKFTMKDIKLENYESHDNISAEMMITNNKIQMETKFKK